MPTGYGMYKRMGGNSTVTFQRLDQPWYDASEVNLGSGGLIEGTTNAEAANNSAKLTALYAAVAAAGGGVILLPANRPGMYWWFAANTNLDTGTATQETVRIVGMGERVTNVMLTGTTGPWFRVQTVTAVPVIRPRWEGFAIFHDSTVTSGADFALSTDVYDANFVDVEWWPTGAGDGAQVCIDTKANLHIDHCRVVTKPSGSPIAISISNTVGQIEIVIRGRSVLAVALTTGYIIDVATVHPAAVDLIRITDGCLLAGGLAQINHTGDAAVYQCYIDECQLDVSQHTVYSVPSARGILDLQIHDSRAYAVVQNFVVIGGTQVNVVLDNVTNDGVGTYFANIQDVTHARVANCMIVHSPAAPSGAVAVSIIGNCTYAEVVDNHIVGTVVTARAGIEIGSAIPIVNVHGNEIAIATGAMRPIIASGARTAGRVLGPNTIWDPNTVTTHGDRSQLAAEILDTHATAPLLWIPSWAATTTDTTSETQTGRVITHSTDVATNNRQIYQGNDRCLVQFSGAHYASTPDTADLSFTAGGFSGFILANVTDTAGTRTFFAKATGSTYEYHFGVDTADKLFLNLFDTDSTKSIGVASSGVISMGRPHLYGFTWDGVNAAGIILYQDNVAVALAAPSSVGVFAAMVNTTAPFEIGAVETHTGGLFVGDIGSILLIPGVATARQLLLHKQRINAYYGLGL